MPNLLPRVTSCCFKVQPIELDELYATLFVMKPSTATGNDGISVQMLQKFFEGLAYPLLDVINSSISTGLVPSSWKHAIVIPIPKGKASQKPSDTRPISILPAITKIVERLVQKQLIAYLEQNHLIANSHHGYRKCHSTETALHVITDEVLRAMDCGEISILVMIDLSKCFDVVPHKTLLDKLALHGVDTDWFANYLSGHTQRVQVRSPDGLIHLSKSRSNEMGIFQGGSLSCILYLLFSDDLSLHVPDGVKIVQFADDTQLLVTGPKADLHRLIGLMESALSVLFQWFCNNCMKVNAAKTQMMVLGTPGMLKSLPPVTLSFCGSTVHEESSVRDLGVTVDRHLNYQEHIDTVCRKCAGILTALSHARHVIPRSVLPSITQALVTSVIRYCLSVYGSCGVIQINRLQKMLNFCARVISGRRKRDHISDVLAQLKWLSAAELVEYHTVPFKELS